MKRQLMHRLRVQKMVVTLKQPKSKNALSGDDNIDNDGEDFRNMTKDAMKSKMKKLDAMKVKTKLR